MNIIKPKIKKFILWSIIVGFLTVATLCISCYFYYLSQIPSVDGLRHLQFKTPLQIFSRDGELIESFGEKRRIPISFEKIPHSFIHAILSAEDTDFYQNSGVEIRGLLRAAWTILLTGKIKSGGSTITMQVAKNCFLSSKRIFSRKIKEILLALRITKHMSKNEILTLYLNKIYFGHRAYGIEAASQIYYGKSIHQLNLAEIAMIAGLPKAPSLYNPLVNPQRALQRRNWILARMLKLNFISNEKYQEAIKCPITASYHINTSKVYAPYFAEMVRQKIIKQYGDQAYSKGFKVYTTLNSHYQEQAHHAVIKGLEQYSQRYGYQGPVQKLGPSLENWQHALANTSTANYLIPAVVTEIQEKTITVLLKNGTKHLISWSDFSWAHPQRKSRKTTNTQYAKDIFEIGHLIWVRKVANKYVLSQYPPAQIAFITLDPQTGGIQSLIGGFDFYQSPFNRATQAERQIGSLIKPFIYTAALHHGLTAATVINDAPFVLSSTSEDEDWRPHNEDSRFSGPIRLRQALYQSKNLVSIRILQQIGIDNTLQYIEKLGLPIKNFPHVLSLSLGAVNLTPLQLAKGYMTLANGGYLLNTSVIDKIVSHDGVIFEKTLPTFCSSIDNEVETKQACTHRVMSPQINYIINDIMKDVIRKGTARRALQLKRKDIKGKTGTTNDNKDAWFVGFTPHILTLVWIGRDDATTLGSSIFGANTALPIWIHYMKSISKELPEHDLPQPPDLVTIRIKKYPHSQHAIKNNESYFELFLKNNILSEETIDDRSDKETKHLEDIY